MKKLIKPVIATFIILSILLIPTPKSFAESSSLPFFSFTNKSILRGNSSMKKLMIVGKNECLKVTAINKSNGRVTLYLENLAGERVYDVMTLLPGSDGAKIKTVEVPIDKGIYYLKAIGSHNVWNGKDASTGNIITFARTKRLKWF